MTEDQAHDRESFEVQGSAFLKQNISEKPEFDYAENRPPHSHRLADMTVTLCLRESPERRRLLFGESDIDIEILGGSATGEHRRAPYEAFELAPDVFFITYLAGETSSVAMALDLAGGAATIVSGAMTDEGIISSVESALVDGAEASAGVQRYHPPFSLGGTRFLNTYAHNVAYEHIYLTGVYETWMGVKGPQAGQADTEEYHAFRITDGVYLLYWNEGILTAQMTFLFNFFRGNCVAELFARVDGEIVHNTIGATTSLIHTKLVELPDILHLEVYSGD